MSDSLILQFVLLTSSILRPILLVRWATFDGTRVGHLVPEFDMVLYLYSGKRNPPQGRFMNIFVLPSLHPNEQIHRMYLRRFRQLPGSITIDAQRSLAGKLLERPLAQLGREARRSRRPARASCGSPGDNGADVWGVFQDRPHVQFSADESRRSTEMALMLGLDLESPYVCLHIRDAGYLTKAMPDRDWSYHNYRNPPPDNFVPVVEHLLRMGIQVVRMGKFAESTTALQVPGLIDYAASDLRDDLLDVFLYSRCKFFIAGGSSGIDSFGLMFGRPGLITNLIPFVNPGYGTETSVVLPALIWDTVHERHLTLSEMLHHRFTKGPQYEARGLTISYNRPDEIIAATDELLGRISIPARNLGSEAQSRQELFWAHADALGIKGTQPTPPNGLATHRSRIGSKFLARHWDLLMN